METKGQLAKLLATEDITVRHSSQAETASFDVKNRVLTLPEWDNISKDTLDMLIGHEVGHALYTHLTDWESAIDSGYHKGILNVIEDARIEKKVKRRYPGIVRSFLTGYKDLVNKGFFGNLSDLEDKRLVDRLNLHFKLGWSVNIPFENEEMEFVSRIEACESWADVLAIADDLMAHSVSEELDRMEDFEFGHGGMAGDSDEDTSEHEIPGMDDDSDGDAELPDGDESSNSHSAGNDDMTRDEMTDALGDDLVETQEEFDQRVQDIVNKQAGEKKYFRLPEPNLNSLIVPYSDILAYGSQRIEKVIAEGKEIDPEYRSYYRSSAPENFAEAPGEFNTFRKRSIKIVNYMAKEFERKKAANEYRKESVSKTGVLDMTKIHQYKYNDDLFLRNTIRPDGKNHGMVMLMDWSGSMADKIFDTVKQTLNMVWFCKKVNIPFEVYAFSNIWANERKTKNLFVEEGMEKEFGYGWDEEMMTDERLNYRLRLESEFESLERLGNWKVEPGMAHFSTDNSFNLLNMISSRMSAKQLTEASRLLFTAGYTMRYYSSKWGRLDLGSTPLLPAVVAMHKVIPNFQSRYGLDKTSLMVLTDGDGNIRFHGIEGETASFYGYNIGNYILEDSKTKKVYQLGDFMTQAGYGYDVQLQERAVMTMLQDKYDVRIVGLLLSSMDRVNRKTLEKYLGWYSYNEAAHAAVRKDSRKTGVATVPCAGYDEFHIVPTAKLKDKSDSLDAIEEDMTAGKMKRIFSKAQGNKVGNKVLVNRLVDRIA